MANSGRGGEGDTQTTTMMDTFSPSTPLAGPGVVGYLNVPPQGPLLAGRNYPIIDGMCNM